MTQTAHVVGEFLHADLGFGPHQTDGSHNGAAHVIGLRAKDMLDPDPLIEINAVLPWCRGAVVPWCRGAVVPWDEIRPLLDPVWRKPMDVVLMFQALFTRFTETFRPAYG